VIRRILIHLRGIFALAFVTINTIIWFVPLMVFAIAKLLLPIKWVRWFMTRLIMAVGENWVSCNTFVFGLVNRTRWDIRGLEDLSRANWYLVIVNHQTWTDIVILQSILNHRIPFLKFFIKQQLIWFPVLGIAWWAMDMPFMKRYSKSYLTKHPGKKGMDLEATRKACEKFRETPTSVINFIEGTRFTEEKKRRRASPYQYLLPPRAGGVALALSSMGKMFDAILDITVVYPTGPTNFWDMFCGRCDHIIIDIVKRPVESWMIKGDYSNDREYRSRFHQWLTETWQNKDKRIAALLEESISEE